MKKNQVNEKFITESKRKNTIMSFICIIIFIGIVSFSSFLLYINRNKNFYITYDEDSYIDYKVYLKENDFFSNNYLESDNQYIASLIKYISSEFKYKLKFEKSNVNFNYSYKIDATIDVKEKNNNKSLYNQTTTILEKKDIQASSNNDLNIVEKLDIDYNHYNNKIKKFINIYGLDEINSFLSINMYINVQSNCEDFNQTNNNQSIMTLNIPLTTKTVGIDISNNLINSNDKVMICKESSPFQIIFLIVGIILVLVDVFLLIYLIKFIENTRSSESKYEKELKKILYNYHSYIQEMSNTFDLSGYKLVCIKTFNDMLEIRDTENKPILMSNNKEKKTTYFLIPTNSNILYVYRLKIKD